MIMMLLLLLQPQIAWSPVFLACIYVYMYLIPYLMPNATAIWRPYHIMRCPRVPDESKRVSMAGYRWRSARLGLLFLAVLPSERSNITGTATAAQLFFLYFFVFCNSWLFLPSA